MSLIQPGQRHHQGEGNLGCCSKKLRNHQDGRMKKHLQNLMTGQLKRNFQTIYLDEMCFFSMYIYIYSVFYTEKTYMVSIIHNINEIGENPGLLIFPALIVSNSHLHERTESL